ncbi:uncharacterized protein LOC108025436 [Drosophila biarmipes]|uniref:uncharacterized protein LOC108025436 n=1 Tax=Drosophila biarmipes TaxID=125945 RepID=UPI0007E64564|nr:uncharacterized protein LOC108025436 [Drosophila biarmipes]
MEVELANVKSLEGLQDCAKLPLDEIDPISRTSRCDRTLQEIFHVDEEVSFSYVEEEEEMHLSELTEDLTDDEDRVEKVVTGIDCLIRKIELMQMAIRNRQAKASSDKVSEETIEPPQEPLSKAQIKCNENKTEIKQSSVAQAPKIQSLTEQEMLEARSLRQAHNVLQKQIDEMVCRYRKLREIIDLLRGSFDCLERNLRHQNSMAENQLAWAHEVAKEMNVCKERYTHLIHAKMSKKEAIKTEKVHAYRFARLNTAYLKKCRLKCEILEFCGEVNDLVVLMSELHQELERNMSIFEAQRISKLERPISFFMSIDEASKLNNEFMESGMKLKSGENTKK